MKMAADHVLLLGGLFSLLLLLQVNANEEYANDDGTRNGDGLDAAKTHGADIGPGLYPKVNARENRAGLPANAEGTDNGAGLYPKVDVMEKHSGQDANADGTENGAGPNTIAFSAELVDTVTVSPGSNIVFNQVHTNVGNQYYPTSGQFLCNDGLYVFIWNIMCDAGVGKRCVARMKSGGVDGTYGPKTSYYDSTYVSGVAQMTGFQNCTDTPVGVTITSAGASGTTSSFFQHFTSFSGFKLQEEVAFQARLSSDFNGSPANRIFFNEVIINAGGSYEATNGIFRCPDSGIYVLEVTTHGQEADRWTVSRLMKDSQVLMLGPMTYKSSDDQDSGSGSITTVVQCTVSSSYYVEVQASHNFTQNSYANALTTFTGFKLYDASTSAVAFSAVMTKNFTSDFGNYQIPFDKIVTNVGNGFNADTSRFTCPDAEYYLFTWTAVTRTGSAEAYLHMDGSIVKGLYTTWQDNSADTGTSGSCAQTVIVQCTVNSYMDVRSYWSGDPYIEGYTSFSGYKIPG